MIRFPFLAMVAALALPAAASAGDTLFNCEVKNAAQPEMTAQLSQADGQSVGVIRTANAEFEALVYEGPDFRTFLVLGDDYSLNYTVNTATGAYAYFADGSRAAEATGTCIPVTASVGTVAEAALKS